MNKEDIQVEKNSKMTEVRPFSLGPDRLNSPTKRQILAEWILRK